MRITKFMSSNTLGKYKSESKMTDVSRLEQVAVLYQFYHCSLLQANPGKGIRAI